MVDIVLGVSMAPTKVRMVLVQGESADGVTVDQDDFDVAGDKSAATAPTQVISAILGTREGAVDAGYQLLSSGVAVTDPVEAAALRDALRAHKIENVMLVSAFMAAAALAQAVGDATNYASTALLFVEPYTATLAVVNTADGSIVEVRRRVLADDDDQAVAELAEMASAADTLKAQPDGLFVVGSGVDIPMIKPALEAATSLELSVPEEPEMALARGAALASANAPLFASSTAALAYAQDPGTGEVDPLVLAGCFAGLPADAKAGVDNVAYSAVPDEDADANTGVAGQAADASPEDSPRRSPLLLVGSSAAVVVISAVVALEIALAIGIRPTVALQPSPNQNLIAPIQQPPTPAQALVPPPKVELPSPVAAPKPLSPPPIAHIPAAAPAPAPVPVVPPPVLVPMVPRVPELRPPVTEPRGRFPESRVPERVPEERGLVPRFGGPFGGGHGFGGPFGGGHGFGGPFGGGHGFGGPFGGGHGFGGPFGGGHGFGGPFGGGHGFGGPFGGGHGFGGFGHR